MASRGNLTARTVEAAGPKPKTYRLSDGGGLLLEVRPTGAKFWTARIVVDGRRRDVGLGSYPDVSLAQAREAAASKRTLARDGQDPVLVRKDTEAAERTERAAAAAARAAHDARTFRAVALQLIEAESPGWKSSRTASLWTASLEAHVFAELGAMNVAEVDRAAVLRTIRPVWSTRPATAKKVLRRIGAVLRYAAAHGWRSNDNPTDPKMLRHLGLPVQPGGRRQPSLPWGKVPAFVKALDQREGVAPLALRLLILTALRSNEVRQARWSWLSFDGVPTLTIPGEIMKGKKADQVRPHRVPLAPAALDTLASAYFLAGGERITGDALAPRAQLMGSALIFPTVGSAKPLSDMALSAVMRRMNADRPPGTPAPWRDSDGREAVPHGMRSAFRTWVDDTRPDDAEAAERALAHEVAHSVQAAYRRSDAFDRRVPLMLAWSLHCCPPAVAPQRVRPAARSRPPQ